jgi:hypothetical protein
MKKSRESKMLEKVRRWRKKAYDADRAKPPAKRMKDAEERAQRLNLPLAQPHETDVDRREGTGVDAV